MWAPSLNALRGVVFPLILHERESCEIYICTQRLQAALVVGKCAIAAQSLKTQATWTNFAQGYSLEVWIVQMQRMITAIKKKIEVVIMLPL
jgi:hypothetical protein